MHVRLFHNMIYAIFQKEYLLPIPPTKLAGHLGTTLLPRQSVWLFVDSTHLGVSVYFLTNRKSDWAKIWQLHHKNPQAFLDTINCICSPNFPQCYLTPDRNLRSVMPCAQETRVVQVTCLGGRLTGRERWLYLDDVYTVHVVVLTWRNPAIWWEKSRKLDPVSI